MFKSKGFKKNNFEAILSIAKVKSDRQRRKKIQT